MDTFSGNFWRQKPSFGEAFFGFYHTLCHEAVFPTEKSQTYLAPKKAAEKSLI